MNLNEIAKIIEGVLFVAGEGVEIDVFKTRFDMNDREFNKCLDILKEKYNENSGINIITYKKKVQLCSNPEIVDSIADILNPIRERSLTKAAIYGHDANWGRILCAMGYSGANFDPEKVDLFFESAAGKLQIIENGVAVDYSEEEASKILSEPHVTAIADIKMGDATATAWGCDLTYDYVKINADYRS